MSKAAGFFLSLMLVVAGGLLLYKLLNNGSGQSQSGTKLRLWIRTGLLK